MLLSYITLLLMYFPLNKGSLCEDMFKNVIESCLLENWGIFLCLLSI